MSTFDIKSDAPGLLRVEALNMTMSFDRTGPTTGRIIWNIPNPAAGCATGTQAYCGILITLDTTPVNGQKVPTNGTVYNSDATADNNLFAGDKLGTAKVVGAFYNDTTTTFLDITGLTPNTPYYISGFPTDCQMRYFREGVHAYSLDYTNKGSEGTTGSQIVILNQPNGVSPTDTTGLVYGATYEFEIQKGVIPKPRTPVDPVYCSPAPYKFNIAIKGDYANTYTELVDELNKQFALIGGTVQGPTAPNTGAFYWDMTTNHLYQWDGSQNIEQTVINQTIDPTVTPIGTYWYNPTDNLLQIKDTISTWSSPTVLKSVFDPQNPIADTSYWFDGVDGYVWNGATWCKRNTYIQNTDPSITQPIMAGSYWYDIATYTMYKWDNIIGMWITSEFIESSIDPTGLLAGAYWFNESTNTLLVWNTPSMGWNTAPNTSVVEREPTTPAPGKLWYSPTTQTLKQWDGLHWVEQDVISFPYDPTQRNYCDTWWNTATNQLNVWDGVHSTWVTVSSFHDQANDPSVSPTINEGMLWYNTSNNTLLVWNNNCFTLVDFVNYPTDPRTTLVAGVVWYNTATAVWKVLDVTKVWNIITPVVSTNDPSNLPVGVFWINPSNSSLQIWNGAAWTSVLYATTVIEPTLGAQWFDTTTNTLRSWNGVSWIPTTPGITVELDCRGNLLFTDTTIGSLSLIVITDKTLFKLLSVPYVLYNPNPGTDSVSDTPTYNEVGVGTDGSPDERLLLMNEIRYELGYPVVDVELTPEQLDYAITKALNEFRSHSGLAYKRGFFFMRTSPETQRYVLSNKTGGFNKVVDILAIQRLTSSFLSSAHGAGVYGQIVLQHLYNMGSFDLLSYHIMAEYTKTMEILFAARLTFTWDEQSRELWIHHRFPFSEPYVSVEATVERTEQDIMTDRYARPWIRRYATAVSRLMLAEIRGKYSTLPGASGSITLNASDLRAAAKEEIELCMQEIENFIADDPNNIGLASTFVFG